jgi:hypothetical protein
MNRPNLRPIVAPLDVDDAALEKLNNSLQVPTLINPAAGTPAVEQEPPQDAPKEEPRPSPTRTTPAAKKPASAKARSIQVARLNLNVPLYLLDAINVRAAQERSTTRHLVLQALAAFGFEIEPADIIPDGRRAQVKRSRSR